MRFAAKLLLLDVIQGHAYDCLLELLRLHSQSWKRHRLARRQGHGIEIGSFSPWKLFIAESEHSTAQKNLTIFWIDVASLKKILEHCFDLKQVRCVGNLFS